MEIMEQTVRSPLVLMDLNTNIENGEQTTGRHGELAAIFWSQLAAKLAASFYYVLFYYGVY